MLQIDKNIPVPEPKQKPTQYPFETMEVGDSFLVKSEEGKTGKQLSQRISPSASRHAKLTNRKYTLRIVEGGVRVWRTS